MSAHIEFTKSQQLGFWLANLFIFGFIFILAGGFFFQFVFQEKPCPLCMLQRYMMMLTILGPFYIVMATKKGTITQDIFCKGYALSLVTALIGSFISVRHILLHIMPGDPGYGTPVLGLHLYTWALISFIVVILFSGINIFFAKSLTPHPNVYRSAAKINLGLFLIIVILNLFVIIALLGFHWKLPDNPTEYQLFSAVFKLQ